MEASSKKKQKTLMSFFSQPKSEGIASRPKTNLPNESERLIVPSTSEQKTNNIPSSSYNESELLLLPSSSMSELEMETDLPSQSDDESEIPTVSKADEIDYNYNNSKWPSIWTREMWDHKKDAFPWLDCQNGKLGCTLCKQVSHLGAFKKERLALTSKEWCSFTVTFNGSTKSAQLTSLRKKIFKHKQSTSHMTAETISAKAKSETIQKFCDKMNASHLECTIKVFRSAYYLAKNDRPYSDHFELLELQQLNGIDIGIGLHSRFSATEIINHVADEMKKRITQQILKITGKISIIIDECTSLGAKSALIVYLKCETSKELPPNFLFLDLIELPNESADTVLRALLNCLNEHCFCDDYLKENLVAFASDGASVMLGKKSGVAEKLAQNYPNIIPWHCMNHRIELAVSDSVDDVGAVNHFQIFMDKLYTLYSKSPKNQRELAKCAHELDLQLNKIGRILGTRWVASSFKSVTAVWYGYQALHSHFNKAKDDKSRTPTERAMYNGLIKRLTSIQFLFDLAIMYDILAELSLLSESLQSRKMTVVYADKIIRRSIQFFEALKDKPGAKCLEVKRAAIEGSFCGVPVIENSKMSAINNQQLLSSIINNLKRRLLTTRSSKEKEPSTAGPNPHQEDYKSLLSELKVLESNSWPSNKPLGYGEPEIEKLCARFRLNANKIKNSYRDYLENSSVVPKDLNQLMNCSMLIPCSSSECERGFSHMNIIITPTRTRLSIPHVSALMFIKLNGPNIRKWNPEPYVRTWLRKHRSADDTRTRRAKPAENIDVDEDIFAEFL